MSNEPDQPFHEHRIFGMFRVGTLTAVNDALPGTQQHQIAFSPLELRGEVPAVTPYGFYSKPHVGADVLVMHAAGDQSKGVVVAVHDQRYRFTCGADGEVAIADDLGQTVHLTRTGIVVNGAGRQVTITNTPLVRMEAALQVTGDVTANCDGGAISLVQHEHISQSVGSPTSAPIAGT